MWERNAAKLGKYYLNLFLNDHTFVFAIKYLVGLEGGYEGKFPPTICQVFDHAQ